MTARAEHYQCSAADYHGDWTHVGNSMLSDFLDHPALFYGRHITGRFPQKERTPLLKGTALHEDILLPGRLESVVVEIPAHALTSDGKRYGNAWKEFAAENVGKVLLKADELAVVAQMAAAVRRNKRAMHILDGDGPTEFSIRWECRETGLKRRCRLDKWNQHLGLIGDLKSARDVTPRGFAGAIMDRGYHRQDVYYNDGMEAFSGERLPFVFVAVQNCPPFAVQCYDLSEVFLELGRNEVRDGLSRLSELLGQPEERWVSESAETILTVDPPWNAFNKQWEPANEQSSN